ncbi:secretion system protein [Frankia sp. CNm7]|uniref:Secretion system protein n=1 Tax=Frankia nepalensis TaxID=1836974 RepID=A0A937UNT4_9ACTN|nr:secretion system protein [Frankia nepalensis]MBL7498274.1 secretion system protein [Frankia nepalensis]MBL7509134.1 secretion system protein [Frankia nepalensis]MBL7521716.1 secretion system protein [Frankia nepalensis]MBL7630179.1 secretion system protein [Frankia nepalensis]
MHGLPAAGLLTGLCGAVAVTGLYLALRAALAPPAPLSSGRPKRWTRAGAAWLTARVTDTAGTARARRLLLADDLAVAGRDPVVHTAVRVTHATIAALAGALLAVAAALTGLPLPSLIGPVLVALAVPVGVLVADRPVRTVAKARRQEARLAVAAYLDLVRVLLAGGLTLHAALRLAADAGTGWAFTQIRAALDTAATRRQPPDSGLDQLAARIPLPEWRELRLTVTSALRGASPVLAMESKATHLRATEAADARAQAATADAELELPAATVALAFVAFLTYPLLAVLTATGITP